MENNNTTGYFTRASSQFNSSTSSKQRRSGYEPSDTETDWKDTPPSDLNLKNIVLFPSQPTKTNKSPVRLHRRHSSKTEIGVRSGSPATISPLRRRRSSKSVYKRVISPLTRSESSNRRKHLSPYKFRKEESDLNKSSNTNAEDEEIGGVGERNSNYSRRSKTASRSRDRPPTSGEINEMIANMNTISKGRTNFENTDSISQGDIFFSRDVNSKLIGSQREFKPRPAVISRTDTIPEHRTVGSVGSLNPNYHRKTSSKSAGSTDLGSRSASQFSESSGSLKKFTANRMKSQTDVWFSCVRKGSCRMSRLSPERRELDEASVIRKAFVVENLRQFWADKLQPRSLNEFLCHKQEAQLLQQIVSNGKCPHILLKGPSGSGKKALAMALLREIYEDSCLDISHDLKFFPIPAQGKGPLQVVVPITSSTHHAELNVNLEANAKYALMGLVKEINDGYAIIPEVSKLIVRADYKVIVLYEVDKAADNIQHLIKWIMDRYTDACKLILCCEDDANILDLVKSRCKVIKVDAPVTREIMEVLLQIAKKENFDLPMSFAAKIANKSKQNLRKAIMALEACKAHNYPFLDEQPIPTGWEEALTELAAEILADPSHKRLLSVRVKIQKLLVEYVHPKLILLKLVEQFLKGIDASLKREVYYWHAYYDKRLPTGTNALQKLEEFSAKFMSIYRRASGNCQ